MANREGAHVWRDQGGKRAKFPSSVIVSKTEASRSITASVAFRDRW